MFCTLWVNILHHAAREPVFGQGIIEELGRHGYKLNAGTLYPLLNAMEQKGYLRSYQERNGRASRRVYRATAQGAGRSNGPRGRAPHSGAPSGAPPQPFARSPPWRRSRA